MLEKEFLLHQIAKLKNGNRFDKNKMTYKNPSVNFVSRTSKNNGISNFVDKIDNIEPYPKGSITLAFGGSIGSTFLQDEPFYTGQNVGVIIFDDFIDYDARLYIITVIEKVCKQRFTTFSEEINKHFKTDLSILLPIKTDNNNPIIDSNCKWSKKGYIPDFDYMKEKIIELKQEIIIDLEREKQKELEQYLIFTDIIDYELTKEDRKILYISGFRSCEKLDSNDIAKVKKEFKISYLFTKKTMKGYPKNKENLTENPNGYYIYGQNIKRRHSKKVLLDKIYLHVIDPKHPILAYTSSVGEIGMIDESFYRSGDNGAFQGLFSKEYNFNRYELQFILSILKKYFVNFGYSTSMTDIMDLSFELPIQTDKNNNPIIDSTNLYHPKGYIPDWNFMEKYIKVIEKYIIGDIVKNKDTFIEQIKIISNI